MPKRAERLSAAHGIRKCDALSSAYACHHRLKSFENMGKKSIFLRPFVCICTYVEMRIPILMYAQAYICLKNCRRGIYETENV